MQFFDPPSFGLAQSVLESLKDDSIRGFGFLVGLRVFNQGEVLLGVELGDEVLETLICELCPVVSDEPLWFPESAKYVSLVKMQDIV